jgi:uncharacterized membrane protein (DUF106 family)
MLKVIFWIIVISIILRIIFYFVLPILRVAFTATNQMRRMQEQMKEMERNMNQPPPPSARKVNREGDYVDYEELK